MALSTTPADTMTASYLTTFIASSSSHPFLIFEDTNSSTTNATKVLWSWTPVTWQWHSILLLILAIVSITGNFLVMLVLFRSRRKLSSTDILIAFLAFADFMTSVFIISFTSARTLPDTVAAQVYCRFIRSRLLMWISMGASIFTLMTITIERLVAVRHPFLFHVFTAKHTIVAVIIMWVIAAIINIEGLYIYSIHNNQCVQRFPTVHSKRVIGILYFLFEYFLPVSVMVVTQILTTRSLNVRAQSLPSHRGHPQHNSPVRLVKVRRRFIKTLFIVIVTFIFCFTPDQIGYIAFSLGLLDSWNETSPFHQAAFVLIALNSCANPFIYAARNPNFQNALKELCGMNSHTTIHSMFSFVKDKTSSVKSRTVDHKISARRNRVFE